MFYFAENLTEFTDKFLLVLSQNKLGLSQNQPQVKEICNKPTMTVNGSDLLNTDRLN